MRLMVSIAIAVALLGGEKGIAQEPQNPHGPIKWECETCHSTTSWKILRSDIKFDHDQTGFRLDGAHANASCGGCHKSPVFNHVSTACADCHTDHHQGQLGSNCADCHTPRSWQPRQDLLLKHAERGFPLTGAHAAADCESCHYGRDRLEYIGTPTDCLSCHRDALQQATDPDHMQLAFQSDCQRCHAAAFATWGRTTYEHPASFPLTGAHRLLKCGSCHVDGFVGTPNQCYDCHSGDYTGTTDPNHLLSGFATTCADCHSTSAWQPAVFDHDATGFPLTGAHTQATCISCHSSGYAGTPGLCYSCHATDYTGTADPDHQANGFPTTCEDCHTTTAWEPSSFDHTTTSFPLTGAHLQATCISCHSTGYAGTSTLCYSCHAADYAGTTDPDHQAAGFATTCGDCHSTSAWDPSTFDHAATGFLIEGRHLTLSCISCHETTYSGTPSLCYACHQSDYESTTDPSHAAAMFPTACESCHTASGWTPSTWDHDALYFPIYSGAHQGRWSNCVECHTVASDFTQFDCTACHEHNQTDMDDKHLGEVPNYEYVSAACYECHPRGNH